MTAPFSVKGLDHVVLRARDAAALEQFYCQLLGSAVERRLDEEFGLVQLRAGNALIDIVCVDSRLGRAGGDPPDHGAPNLDHFCVAIEPFDEAALREHLASLGVQRIEVQRRYGAGGFGPSIYVRDPEGNTIELKGPPED